MIDLLSRNYPVSTQLMFPIKRILLDLFAEQDCYILIDQT